LSSRLIARLLATSALAGAGAAAPMAAMAQDEALAVGERTPAPLKAPTAADEEKEEILFEAETVTRASDLAPIVAEGNVRAYVGERYLRADRLSYDPATDVVIAEGNVSITDRNLETVFAGRVELTGDLRDGIAENFSAILEENARLAADSAVREQGARTRLRNAVYTACGVCDDDGEATRSLPRVGRVAPPAAGPDPDRRGARAAWRQCRPARATGAGLRGPGARRRAAESGRCRGGRPRWPVGLQRFWGRWWDCRSSCVYKPGGTCARRYD